MKVSKKGCVEERVWEAVTGLITEKTGETKGQVLERIVQEAKIIQRRMRSSRQRVKNRSTDTPTTFERVAAKART